MTKLGERERERERVYVPYLCSSRRLARSVWTSRWWCLKRCVMMIMYHILCVYVLWVSEWMMMMMMCDIIRCVWVCIQCVWGGKRRWVRIYTFVADKDFYFLFFSFSLWTYDVLGDSISFVSEEEKSYLQRERVREIEWAAAMTVLWRSVRRRWGRSVLSGVWSRRRQLGSCRNFRKLRNRKRKFAEDVVGRKK